MESVLSTRTLPEWGAGGNAGQEDRCANPSLRDTQANALNTSRKENVSAFPVAVTWFQVALDLLRSFRKSLLWWQWYLSASQRAGDRGACGEDVVAGWPSPPPRPWSVRSAHWSYGESHPHGLGLVWLSPPGRCARLTPVKASLHKASRSWPAGVKSYASCSCPRPAW